MNRMFKRHARPRVAFTRISYYVAAGGALVASLGMPCGVRAAEAAEDGRTNKTEAVSTEAVSGDAVVEEASAGARAESPARTEGPARPGGAAEREPVPGAAPADATAGDTPPPSAAVDASPSRPDPVEQAPGTAENDAGGAAASLSQIRGRVLAKGTGDPLFGAMVVVGDRVVAETDAQGRFELELAPGEHQLTIQHATYQILDLRITVEPGGRMSEPVTLRLLPQQSGERYETIVDPPNKEAPRIVLRADELTRLPGTMGDPLRTVESLPGVSQVVWPLALYTVRGANPGNTGFHIDGVRMPALYHFALGPSVIHPMFIESVSFYPGGYPAEFGRYTAGIVNAETRTPKTDRIHGSVDVRLIDAGGFVTMPFNDGKGTVALAGRLSYSGLLFSAFSPDITFNYWDYQARIDHVLGPGRFRLFLFGSGDHLGRKDERASDLSADLAFHRIVAGWRGAFLGGNLDVASTTGFDSSSTFIPELNNLPVSVAAASQNLRVLWQRRLAERVDFKTGLDGEWQRLRPKSVQQGFDTPDVLRRRTYRAASAHMSLILEPFEGLTVTPGVRMDLLNQEGVTRHEWGPRLAARWQVSENFAIKGAGGRFVQLPSLPIAVPGFENFGLRSIGLQTSWQGSLGFETAIGDIATLDVTGFYQRLRVTDLASIFVYDVHTELLELRDGRSYGAEFMLRRAVTERLFGWVAYTLSKSERVLSPLNRLAASDWDQRHILNTVLSYRAGNGYQVGARFHYNSGRPYPVYDEGSVSASDIPPIFYQNLPDFYQFDVRLDKRWIFDRYVLNAYFELINTTLTEQVFDLKRRADGTLQKTGYRIALPSVGVRAEW